MGVFKYSGKRGVTYSIDYYVNGDRIREKVGPNKKEAQELLGKRMQEIREGRFFGGTRINPVPIEQAIKEYRKRTAHLKSQSTLKYCLETIERHFAGRCTSTITEKDIDDFIITRREVPTRWKTRRAGGTVNREVSCLRAVLTMAVRQGMMSRNPASRPRMLPENRGRLRYLSIEEAALLLDLAKKTASKDIFTLILVALDTGMRRGEIFNIHREDLDFKNNQIWVRAPKNGTPRYVPMTARVRDVLNKRPRRIDTEYVFAGRIPGKHLSNGIREVFVTLCQRAGIKDFRFHDLRHTFASHLAMAGVPLHAIGQILGHKTPSMTARYSHLSPEFLKQAVMSLPEWTTTGKTSDQFLTKDA